MKYIVVLGDGMADRPLPQLSGRTPLQAAHKPHMDYIAAHGTCGMASMVPDGMPPQSDTANLAVLGYDPKIYYRGRSPLEAVSMGIELAPDDIAMRCNIVTLSDEPSYPDRTMIDYSAGEIPTEEGAALIEYLAECMNTEQLELHAGKSYRHCLVIHHAELGTDLTPPHDITGIPIRGRLPGGRYGELLSNFMVRSSELLSEHPINRRRAANGERPANSCWFWGEGTRPELVPFERLYGVHAGMVCAVDLLKGLGICTGMEVPAVPGATGAKRTDFAAKGRKALELLSSGTDLVYIHIEAPDESGHAGDVECKIEAIEHIDRDILGFLMDSLSVRGEDFAVMLLPDHPTPIEIRTHSSDPVPFVLYDSRQCCSPSVSSYCESEAESTGLYIKEGHTLMKKFISLDF